MEEVGIVMAALAMLVALCAIWLAGDARRRAEGQTVQFIRGQAAVLRKGIEEVAAAVAALDSRLKAAEGKLAVLERERGDLDGLREDLAIMRRSVIALQEVRSVPRDRAA